MAVRLAANLRTQTARTNTTTKLWPEHNNIPQELITTEIAFLLMRRLFLLATTNQRVRKYNGVFPNGQTHQGQWQIVRDSYSLFFSVFQGTPVANHPRRLPDGISRLLPTPYPSSATNTLSATATSVSFSITRTKDQPYFALSSIGNTHTALQISTPTMHK